MVDRLADRPEGRRRHDFALHQAPGRLFLEGQGGDEGFAFGLGQGGQHRLLPVLLQILEDGRGVVGFQFLKDLGDIFGVQGLDDLFADIVVKLGQQVAHGARRDPGNDLFAIILGQEAQ